MAIISFFLENCNDIEGYLSMTISDRVLLIETWCYCLGGERVLIFIAIGSNLYLSLYLKSY